MYTYFVVKMCFQNKLINGHYSNVIHTQGMIFLVILVPFVIYYYILFCTSHQVINLPKIIKADIHKSRSCLLFWVQSQCSPQNFKIAPWKST